MHRGKEKWAYDLAAEILSGFGFPPDVGKELERRIVETLLKMRKAMDEEIAYTLGG